MATYTNSRIQLRVDTEGAWQSNNPTIQAGEICISSDKLDFKVGAGSAWNQAAYCIKNNPEVVAIKTTANNAASSASSAMNRANQAYNIAQAAGQTAGRVVNSEFLKEKEVSGEEIVINADFIKEHRNTDFIFIGETLKAANIIKIESLDDVNETAGNTISFYYQTTNDNTYIVSSLFVKHLAAEGYLGLIANSTDLACFDQETGIITVPVDSAVEFHIIDNYVFKYAIYDLSI